MQKIVEKLKNIEQLRNTVRKIKRGVRSIEVFRKRTPGYFFHSPRTTLLKSKNATVPTLTTKRFAVIENNPTPGLTIWRNVISFPFRAGTAREYSGGIVNPNTHQLIEQAIHLGDAGQFTQELPANYNDIAGGDLLQVEQVVLYGGILFHHFGHFLLESLGRLWAYNHLKDLDPFILFYNDSAHIAPPYLDKTNFIHQVLKGFDIPPEKLLFIDQPARIKQLIVPEQKYGFTFRQHPDSYFLEFINTLRTGQLRVPAAFKNSFKIYVSRAKISLGRVIGECNFEAYLQAEGYHIFYPEDYTINQQLAVYHNAQHLVFCDGSAIHACILLPKIKAAIAVVARRYDGHSAARNILCQFEGYNKETLWIDCIKVQYQFGLESWHALTVVDWLEVSKILIRNGFASNAFTSFHEIDLPELLRSEMQKHIEAVRSFPEFTGFMMKLNETLPGIELK